MARGICYFCREDRILSKEHYFPKWTRKHVPIGKNVTANNFSTGEVKNRDVGTLTFQHVCKECNGGWMSGIQNRAKPHIVPLLTAERWNAISSDAAEAISAWSVMTAMVCAGEVGPEVTEIAPAERRDFALTEEITPDWQIWIGRSPHGPDRGGSRWHIICRDGHEVNGIRKPWIIEGFLIGQIFVMLIGKLIVLAWNGSHQTQNIAPLPKWGMVRIWPSSGIEVNPPSRAFPTHYNPRVLKQVVQGELTDPEADVAWPYGVSPLHPDTRVRNVPVDWKRNL